MNTRRFFGSKFNFLFSELFSRLKKEMLDEEQYIIDKLEKGKLEFMVPDDGDTETKKCANTDVEQKNKDGILRRFIHAACSCFKKGEKEKNEDDFVMFNPSFKPA